MRNLIFPLAVETRNSLNTKAMEVQKELTELLAPYQDRKVRKISGYGGWVAKLEPQLTAYFQGLQADGFRGWLACDWHWLHLRLDTTYPVAELVGGGHSVDYVKADLSVGKINDAGELVELFPLVELRTDYSPAWVDETRAQAYALESQAQALRSSLREFDK
jgi:hypothetical protein